MFRVQAIHHLPDNFPDFVDEIAAGLSQLYGPSAARRYREVAPRTLGAVLTHPSVCAVAALASTDRSGEAPVHAAGLVVALIRGAIAQVSLVHVLKAYAETGVELPLLREMVTILRKEGVEGIVCESIPMTSIDLDSPFENLEFTTIERLLMIAPLNSQGLARPTLRESQPLSTDAVPEVAEVIVDSYTNHPGRNLHAEVRSLESAQGFVQTALAGGYGVTRASYSRLVQRNGRVVAALVGCEVAPGVGFVLQVVVRQSFQGQGLGTLLLQEVAQCFHEGGLDRLALGVTASNPARRLYERLGFRKVRPVKAYVWWRDTCDADRGGSRIHGEQDAAPGAANGEPN